jgi:hypothetical protein
MRAITKHVWELILEKESDQLLAEDVLKELGQQDDMRCVEVTPGPLQTDRLTYHFKHKERYIVFSFIPGGTLESKRQSIKRGLIENIPLL